MKVPYQLRLLPASLPATALLVTGRQVEAALRVCAEMGADPLLPIYAVADGYVLKLPEPSVKQLPGVIRLRGLSEHLWVPVNAELIPPLLADEAEALVRRRGLVFLPGARVLEYDPEQPIPAAALLRVGAVRRRPWQAYPIAPALADDVAEITFFAVDPQAEEILEAGGEGIATEDPTLEEGSPPGQLLGNTLFSLGKGLAWLGQALNARPLAGLGASMLNAAMAMAPRLSKKLMGEQEATLRNLLKQFREGNIEKALRHALPLGGDPARGAALAQSARLPTHNLFYSLLNLLGNSGNAASAWFTPDNTYYELLAEYRKQAELAVSRGDFRRAAFIYARLLNDYASAARALSQGGLHRDAAIIHEKKGKDLRAAAKEWEAAGEFDRAIQLYRKMADHLAAGDLLRRIGEEDRAVQEYRLAAARLLADGPRQFEAGELLRVRAERPDLALDYYLKGWDIRPQGNALLCATRIVQQHAAAGLADPFLAVLTQAEQFLGDRDAESTANFFTEVARLAQTPSLAPIAEEMRDRALVGIARKMRQNLHGAPGRAAALGNMLNTPSVWPVPLAGDAQYALSAATPRTTPVQQTYPTIRARDSTVTAICQMPSLVFLGFDNGEVVMFQPESGEVHLVTRESGPILSLVGDTDKTYLSILSEQGPNQVWLRVVSREFGYRMIAYHRLDVTAPARLATPALGSKGNIAVLCHGAEYRLFLLQNLLGIKSGFFNDAQDVPDAVVFGKMPAIGSTASIVSTTFWMLAIYDRMAQLLTERSQRFDLDWSIGMSEDSTLRQILLHAVLQDSSSLEIAGIDSHGSLFRATLSLENQMSQTTRFHPIGSERYRAFACVRPNLMAGVHAQGVDWWTPARVRPAQTKLPLGNPVAAFPLPNMRELLIVGADGLLTRVPIAE